MERAALVVWGTLRPFTQGKIRRVLHKTRLDAIFPYKRHISSKIRRGSAKTRVIREDMLV